MMLLPGLIVRLTTQHRALYCYLLLSIWLFLLLGVISSTYLFLQKGFLQFCRCKNYKFVIDEKMAYFIVESNKWQRTFLRDIQPKDDKCWGMYKYIGAEDSSLNALKHSANDLTTHSFSHYVRPDIKTKRVLRVCNPPPDIFANTEGFVNLNYTLESVLVLLRHGDRGPLTHVRNISNINCASYNDQYFDAYETYMENITGTPLLFQLLGPFHGFPLIPNVACSLGQLTRVGVSQLLTTGRILRKIYLDRLGLTNLTTQDDIVVYSTKYRRTLQSGLAFLYSFLSPELFHSVILRESQSLQFCFDDCACPAIDIYVKKCLSESSAHLKSHPAVLKLVRASSSIVYEIYEKNLASDPYSLRDALLTYVCHGARLPCLDSDVCVRTEHVTGLFAYIEWEARQYNKSPNVKKACLLRAYGLVRNIVSHLVRIISEKKPKFVLYSGHDKTIQYLTTALGVISDATVSPHYASRLIFEVYRNTESMTVADNTPVGSDYYFRLVFNGKDITNRIHFCRGGGSTTVMPIKKTSQIIYLCPIESIIRFLHDDYFMMLNTTNLKDACVVH